MLGAIAGDIIGSPYEFKKVPVPDFDLFTEKSKFTDDTVLTLALSDSILNKKDWISTLHEYYDKYQDNGFAKMFREWCETKNREPYNSWGNGSAMRVSSVAWIYKILPEVLKEAKKSAEVTHNDPSAIKGAQAIASCIFLARTTKDKQIIHDYVVNNFYRVDKKLNDIRQEYLQLEDKRIACSCEFSVPSAIECFLESDNFEDCIRKSVLLGGDTDTVACMAGGIAEAFYEIPTNIIEEVWVRLDDFLQEKYKEFSRLCDDAPEYKIKVKYLIT